MSMDKFWSLIGAEERGNLKVEKYVKRLIPTATFKIVLERKGRVGLDEHSQFLN